MDDSKFGSRNKRGDWKPFELIPVNPPFIIPFQPIKLFKFIFGWNGYIFPWQFLWAFIAVMIWLYLTPSLERMQNFEIGWLSFIFFRNAILVFLYAGFFHLHFYIRKSQGNSFKYNARPLDTNSSKFLFKNQTKDNLTYVFLSAIPIWTAYEAVTYWAFANNLIPMISWEYYPVYLLVLFCLIPIIRDVHFYFAHRLIHWGPLYRIAHKVHHLNTNPGPWSGLSMHPIEHLIYFTGVFIHWIIPSHPLLAMYHLFHAGLAPHAGHAGYEKMVFKNGLWMQTGDYDHYLHHKYFECNYAGSTVNFLDKVFGTFHDGSDEATEKVMKRLKGKSYL